MKTYKEIRNDLREIKYYFARKNAMDASFEDIGENRVIQLIEKYNEIVKKAPSKLYDLYVSLYIKSHTQSTLADSLGYTGNYIYQLNRRLLVFIYNEINKGENDNESNAWFY